MDNCYILLLILKKGINVATFINWYFDYESLNDGICPNWVAYATRYSDGALLGNSRLDEFEYNYFVSYLRLRNFL